METKDQSIGNDSSHLFNTDGSSNGDDDREIYETNCTDPLIFPNRATLNSAAARFMDRENMIEGHGRLDSGEGSSTQGEIIHPTVASLPEFLRSGTMRSQSRDAMQLGQPQTSFSEVDTDRLIIESSQTSSSQTDSDFPGGGSRKRRRALSPPNRPESPSPSFVPQHHR